MDSRQPLVSIRCTVYNHEPYLRQCLEGFVMQKTDFAFEAIVHDDASTDNSAAIIREYAAKYPDIIKPIYETENQYSKADGSLTRILDEAIAPSAKYIAMCEGDDYWTDPNKLQQQVDFLESHPDYLAITHNSIIKYTDQRSNHLFSNKPERDIKLPDLVKNRQFATASILIRREAFIFGKKRIYDTMLWCHIASLGKIRYIPIVSSVYNRGNHGMVEGTPKYKWAQIIEYIQSSLMHLYTPMYYPKAWSKTIIMDEYWTCFINQQLPLKQRFLSLCKCIYYAPMRTLKHIIKWLI